MILGIYGGGSLGREVLEIARDINDEHIRWEEIVYILDYGFEGSIKDGISVLSLLEFAKLDGEKEAVIAVGEPSERSLLMERLFEHNINLSKPIIHPTAKVYADVSIGDGVIVFYFCVIASGARVERNVCIQSSCGVGHDVIIGENCVLAGGVRIAGYASIGNNVFIGLLVPIRDRVTIGKNSIISIGAVVQNDIPEGVIAMGNPARVLKKNVENKIFKKK